MQALSLMSKAQILTHNWDYIQESFCLGVPELLQKKLDSWKKIAKEKYDNDVGYTVFFGGEQMQINGSGVRGKSWVLKNDDFIIMIGAGNKDWKVSVRYLAGGLWEYSLLSMKDRILKCLLSEMHPQGITQEVNSNDPQSWQRLSRADYAFDFYSPSFTAEMQNRQFNYNTLVMPARVKGDIVFSSTRIETITIGLRAIKNLQIQIYDKSLELTAIKGKEWMFKIYEEEGYHPPDELKHKHIWRVEIRIGKEFLKNHGGATLQYLLENLQSFLITALKDRRLIIDNGEKNKARDAQNHYLWDAVEKEINSAGNYMARGRFSSMRPEAKAEMLEKGIAGSLRSLQVLKTNDYHYSDSVILAQDCALTAEKDPENDKKIQKAKEKYKWEGEAN